MSVTLTYQIAINDRIKIYEIVIWLETHVGVENKDWWWLGLDITVPSEEYIMLLKLKFGL